MAFNGLAGNYISSAKYAAVTAWATGAAKTLGQIVRQLTTPTVGNERCFVCTTAGTTHATTEPTWVLTRGSPTTDNTVTWTEMTGVPALNGDGTTGPTWLLGAKGQTSSVGHVIVDAATTHVFMCTVSGTSGSGAEPSWNTAAVGNTTADNTATWMYLGLTSSFTKWGAPHARIQNALVSNWGDDLCNKFYVGHDHAESYAIGLSWTDRGQRVRNVPGHVAGPLDLICVNTAGSTPPVSADLATTGTVTTTGSNSITLQGFWRVVYGLSFIVGSGGSGNSQLQVCAGAEDQFFENCTFALATSGASATFQLNNANSSGRIRFKGCTYTFGNAGQTFSTGCAIRFDDCTFAATGTVPTTLISGSGVNNDWVFNGCDLSALSAKNLFTNLSTSGIYASFNDCKFPSSWNMLVSPLTGNHGAQRFTVSRCHSSGNNWQFQTADVHGTLTAVNDVTVASGAVDNATQFSWKVDTMTGTNMGSQYFQTPQIGVWNPTIGANVTVTMYGIVNAAAVPTNAEVWMETTYLGTSGSTKATRTSGRVADFLATPANLTTDTSAWDANVTARANTTAYVLGQAIKTASNSGRVFFCTTAGTSAGSEPGGYASAVDGGSVTDGTAIFRAGCRFKMATTYSSPQPQIVGNIYASIFFGAPSVTYYIDPQMNLT
jgi:hypothetical protein